jgi:ABC-type nitrate/sulfonate/bicarbonate transport system ATPase subunit
LLRQQDIALTFGAAPLLSGAGLTVAAGDRICLVGRNGSGKSTLLGIAAGLVQADAGERFAQPGTTIQYLPQEPDLAGFATALAYVEAGFDAIAADGHHRALYLLKELGLCGNEDAASCPAARHVARSWLAPWLRHPTSCFSTSRPITWTCPASSGWSANWPNCARASS